MRIAILSPVSWRTPPRHYVAISESDKSPQLDYVATFHHGIDIAPFTFSGVMDEYLLFFGRNKGKAGKFS